jgi:amidase
VTWACYEDGKRRTAVELIDSMDYNNTLSRKVGAFFQKYDLLITPTLARLPVRHGEINQNQRGLDAFGWTRQVFSYCPFTPLFNSTGQPAISLPMHWSEGGVPVGVQIAGRFADEATLIRIASQLEEARPWNKRKPPVHSSN